MASGTSQAGDGPTRYCIHTVGNSNLDNAGAQSHDICLCPNAELSTVDLEKLAEHHRRIPFLVNANSPILQNLDISVEFNPESNGNIRCGNFANCHNEIDHAAEEFSFCITCFTPFCAESCSENVVVQMQHIVNNRALKHVRFLLSGDAPVVREARDPHLQTELHAKLESWRPGAGSDSSTDDSSRAGSPSGPVAFVNPVLLPVPLPVQSPPEELVEWQFTESATDDPDPTLSAKQNEKRAKTYRKGSPVMVPKREVEQFKREKLLAAPPLDSDEERELQFQESKLLREADYRRVPMAGGKLSDTDPSGGEGGSTRGALRPDPRPPKIPPNPTDTTTTPVANLPVVSDQVDVQRPRVTRTYGKPRP